VYKALTIPTIVFNSELNKKYQTSPLSEEDKKNYLQRIKAYMELEKPYLNANFTLNDLSKEISVPIRYVSQVLNETLNQKFYDHVNQYRIEETKRILSDSSQIDKNISEILYETGFNAKSVFNKSFKKHVGVTPREFREQCQKQAIEKN
jgi:YesN/AraC family two-component response regulator